MKWIRLALWLLLAAGLMGQAAPPTCTLTGIVVNPDGSPFVNGTINFNSKTIQVINSFPVYPTIVNTNTDASGNIAAVALPQGLVMQITVCPGKAQAGSCSAPFSAIVPNSTTALFGNMAQGTNLTPGIVATSLSVSGTTSLDGTSASSLLVPQDTTPILFGSSAVTPLDSLRGSTDGNVNLLGGAYFTGTNYTAASNANHAAAIWQVGANAGGTGTTPGAQLYFNTGLTAGTTFAPTIAAQFNATGLNLASGETYQINGVPIIKSGTFTPTIVGTGSNPTVTYIAQTGYWAQVGNIAYYFLRVQLSALSGGSGSMEFTFSGAGVPTCMVGTGASNQYAIGAGYGNGLALTAGYTGQVVEIIPTGSYLEPVEYQPAGSAPQGFPFSNVAPGLDYLTSWVCEVY